MNTAIETMTNDDLDAALVRAMDSTSDDEDLLEALFAERSRRIAARQAEIAAAEAAWEAEVDALARLDADRPDTVRVRKLTGLQLDRLEDEAGLVTTEDGVEGGFEWTSGRTYFEGSRELVEALYDRVDGSEALSDGFNAETEAQQAMTHRAAIVSREALAAKLAAALDDRSAAERHRSEARRVSRLSVYRVLEEC